MRPASPARKLARSPWVQAAAAVGLVYAAVHAGVKAPAAPPQLPIRISAADYGSALRAWEKVHRQPPTEEERELILDRLASEEALFRRALELGLDETPITDVRLKQLSELVGGVDEHGSPQNFDELKGQDFAKRDPIMRGHLIQTMKLVAKKVEVPTGDELLSFYALERERFERPAMYALEQVYFSEEKRGQSAANDAERALRELRGGEVDPITMGDRFNAGSRFSMRPASRVRAALGEEVATAIESAPIGRWIGPLESTYGWHLVRVVDSVPTRAPKLATISSEVLHTYLRIRGEEKLALTLRSLRLRYGVEVERL